MAQKETRVHTFPSGGPTPSTSCSTFMGKQGTGFIWPWRRKKARAAQEEQEQALAALKEHQAEVAAVRERQREYANELELQRSRIEELEHECTRTEEGLQ